MALTEYASGPFPLFAKLAIMLRNLPAVQFVFAKGWALLRSDKTCGEPLINNFLVEVPGVSRSTLDKPVATLKPPGEIVIPEPVSSDQSEREKLIRRRWTETGIKMWNAEFHGIGRAPLNIQGRSELLPVKPGETMHGYDKLEFKLIEGFIVCEDVLVASAEARVKNERNHLK